MNTSIIIPSQICIIIVFFFFFMEASVNIAILSLFQRGPLYLPAKVHTWMGINWHYKEMLSFIINMVVTMTQWYCCKCTTIALNEYSCCVGGSAAVNTRLFIILLKDFNSVLSYGNRRRLQARCATDITWYSTTD